MGEMPNGIATNDDLKFKPNTDRALRPKIVVIGAGGAGCNAINNMIRSKLEGVAFVACNTDAQSLDVSLAEKTIQLGLATTEGLGAGSRPDVGRAAAEETIEEILEEIKYSNMVFITAGMGGGTGTGAAPVIAKAARSLKILTVAVVTKPFHFEGTHRMRTAERGIEELQEYVDTLIVIPNQNLFRVTNERTTFHEAFKIADGVLHAGVCCVTDLMIKPGLINLDYADVNSVMRGMGKAMMGTGEAEGDNRAKYAAEAAISNQLIDEVSMKGARGVLINITGGEDMTLFEVDDAVSRIRDEVDPDANIIFGATFDSSMRGIRVSVVATGIEPAGAKKSAENFAAEKNAMPATLDNAEEKGLPDNRGNYNDNLKPSLIAAKVQTENHGYAGTNNNFNEPAKKKSPSLLERLTGRHRAKHNELPEQKPMGNMPPVYSEKSPPIQQTTDTGNSEDALDIPAFLRRRN